MTNFTRCDLCQKSIDATSAKLYLTPVLPGKPAIMANYSHHADVCSACHQSIVRKMNRRKKRKTATEKHPLRSDAY